MFSHLGLMSSFWPVLASGWIIENTHSPSIDLKPHSSNTAVVLDKVYSFSVWRL
jgi:hypothetical protein